MAERLALSALIVGGLLLPTPAEKHEIPLSSPPVSQRDGAACSAALALCTHSSDACLIVASVAAQLHLWSAHVL